MQHLSSSIKNLNGLIIMNHVSHCPLVLLNALRDMILIADTSPWIEDILNCVNTQDKDTDNRHPTKVCPWRRRRGVMWLDSSTPELWKGFICGAQMFWSPVEINTMQIEWSSRHLNCLKPCKCDVVQILPETSHFSCCSWLLAMKNHLKINWYQLTFNTSLNMMRSLPFSLSYS